MLDVGSCRYYQGTQISEWVIILVSQLPITNFHSWLDLNIKHANVALFTNSPDLKILTFKEHSKYFDTDMLYKDIVLT